MSNIAKTGEIIEKVLRQVMEEKFEREWIGLTDEEIEMLNLPDKPTVKEFVRFIEAALRKKNDSSSN